MRELLNLIGQLPAAFWSAIVAALLTLAGVAISNRAQRQQVLLRLEHERVLSRQQREMQLRKEVYLAAAEAVAEGLNLIPRLADLNVPSEKLGEKYAEKSAAISKFHVVASEGTTKALAQLTSELSATYFRLLVKRFPLVMEKQQLAFLEQQLDEFGRERDRMVMLMKEGNLDGSLDSRRMAVLERNFEFEQKRVDETLQRQKSLHKVHYQNQLDYLLECLRATRGISILVVPLVASVRRELELPFDETAYSQMLNELSCRQEEVMQRFVEDARKLAVADDYENAGERG